MRRQPPARRAAGPALQTGAAVLLALALAIAAACAGSGVKPQAPPAPPSEPASAETPPAPPSSAAEDATAAAEPVEPLAPLPPGVEPIPGDGAVPSDPASYGPIVLRVGLASDLDQVELPAGLVLSAGDDAGAEPPPVPALTPVRVRPGGALAGVAVYRLQVAALRDEGQAGELARRLRASTGEEAEVSFDAATGFYRVRLGRWPDRAAADSARTRLAGRGVTEAWVVSEGGDLRDPELLLAGAGGETSIRGRWLAASAAPAAGTDPAAAEGIRVSAGRYRGRVLIYLNDRGRLNLINELPLEDYLRGVVPAEMGPALYPRLEALKAQTVAARTYTLRNLGEFDGEGFDICATPRCQVYRGMAIEHPLSDRAIAETAGQVLLWNGELVDARYSATCGGHTEDVETVFPLEDAPYLRGVPCAENGGDRLAGALPRGETFPDALVRRLFPQPGAATTEELLASLEEIVGYHRALESAGGAGGGGGRRLLLRVGAEERAVELPAALATFRLRRERLESADLALAPGDRVRLYLFDGYPVALVQEAEPDYAAPERPSSYAAWSRFRSDARLARLVEERYPGLGFTGLEVLERGVSGRVRRLHLLGAGGRSAVVEGLAVRWTLDLPDTRFTAERHRTRGETGWLFRGSGWGHGVGLCQLGAYGMAGRGQTYRQILQHYYSGVTLARVRARASSY